MYFNMKKFFLLVVLAVMTASFAQAQIKFGARAGFNLTSASYKIDVSGFDAPDTKFKPGFQIGVVGELALTDAIFLQPGILFATQGYKVEDSGEDKQYNEKWDDKETFSLNYLQIPINVQYKLDLGGMNLLLQAGPYLGYAIGGKYKYEWNDEDAYGKDSGSKEEDLKFGSDAAKGEIKPFDFGIGLGVGLQFSNLQVGLGYNLGLTNLSNADKVTVKNNGLAVTLTFLFGN
jgi:hypothetical protein